jgi:hypothetical protein
MTLLEAVAAIDALPQLTRDIEDAVHVHGEAVRAISRALTLSEAEVQQHFQAARDARMGLQPGRCLATRKPRKEPVPRSGCKPPLLRITASMPNSSTRGHVDI